MKPPLIIAMALFFGALLSGCQGIAEHNAKVRAYKGAGQAAAVQGRAIALQALQDVKGIKSTNNGTP